MPNVFCEQLEERSMETMPYDDHRSRCAGRDMLCFSHDWNSDPLSKTHLMRLMARDNRVLWVNSIGYRSPNISSRDVSRAVKKILAAAGPLQEPEKNIHVLSPLIIPAYGRPWVRSLNRWLLQFQVRRAMGKLGFERPINWVFNPAAAVVAGSLGEDRIIYYCVDEYTAFSGVDAPALAAMERELLAKADSVIVSSDRLYQAKRPFNPRTVLVRHGVDWSHFRGALDPQTQIPEDLARLPGPVIGYFGLIADDWVDAGLIAHLARSLPHASIVMLGKITMDVSALKRFANIHFLGRKPYQSLPGYCRGFDAAIIPFPINQATLNANPLKVREYLAAGLPVVSTAIPEVRVLNSCRIGSDPDEFVQQIEAALADPGPSIARSDAMREHGWAARLDEIYQHLSLQGAERQQNDTEEFRLAA
jgi:glycosyltransferase involved in cell wall biosynthesis